METDEIIYPLFQCPGSLLLNGPSFSGKSSLVCRILLHRDRLFSKKFQNIIYCYAETPGVVGDTIDNIHLHHGLPTQEVLDSWLDTYGEAPWVLILDDMSIDFYNSDISAQLLSRLVHHHSCFLMVVSHSLFGGGRNARLASLNYHYFILTRNCRDTQQISRFGLQLFGKGYAKQFLQIYQDATDIRPSQRAGYLFVHAHPLYSQKSQMLYTNIFDEDGEPLVLYRMT